MLAFLLRTLFIFILFVIFMVAVGFIVDRSLRSRGWRGPVTDHFDGRHFYNIGMKERPEMSRGCFLKWILNRPPNTWVFRKNPASLKPKERVVEGELVVTMVGHASLLIQTEGVNILTDPIWSKRASPFSFLGPKRYRNPGIAFEDLPPIDLILISHNHYDHMDVPTLKRLHKKWNTPIVVGLGNKSYLEDRGILNVTEIDWWDTYPVGGGVVISSVPAQHFSARALSDRNTTLWGGYVIETQHGNIYVAGDTGYGEFISEIAERYTSFRVALIPIGAFKPEFFMGPVHVSPQEALQMAQDIKAETMIPMHYGTFHLADDQQDEPLESLQGALQRATSSVEVVILEPGEQSTL